MNALRKWLIALAAGICAGFVVLAAVYLAYATEQWLGMRESALADIERYEHDLDYPNRESNLEGARQQLAAVKSELGTRVGIPALAFGIACLALVPLWRAAARLVGRWRIAALSVFMTVALAGALTLFMLYAMRGVITG